MAEINEYEQERARLIARNRMVLDSLGVTDAARALAQESARPSTAAQPKRERKALRVQALHTERRRSSRVQGGKICYQEDSYFQELQDDEAVTPQIQGPRIANTYLRKLTPEQVEQIRAQHGVQAMTAYTEGQEGGQEVQAAVTQALAEARANRKPVDSGRGVRIQGGRVYDSRHGITCHWCRQKTLDDHVTCSRPECGGGSRLPITFCAKCLLNRHGEDQVKAAESGQWVCPPCRGTCGPGCVSCCNCGPCRKKLNLEPTRQLAQFVKTQGFSNVHDYLVHTVTGESFEVIQARKAAHPWGKWMEKGQQQQESGASGSSNDAVNSNSNSSSTDAFIPGTSTSISSSNIGSSPAPSAAPVTPGSEPAAAAAAAAAASPAAEAPARAGAEATVAAPAAGGEANAADAAAAGGEDIEHAVTTAQAEAPPTRKRGRPAATAAFRAVKPRVGAQQKQQKQQQQKQEKFQQPATATRRVTRSCAARAGAA